MVRTLNRGEELTKEELQEIVDNLIISNHATHRIKERNSTIEEVNYNILNSFLAYFNTDYSINIAINEHQCYVITRHAYIDGAYILLTYKDDTHYTMSSKQRLAMLGIDRKN